MSAFSPNWLLSPFRKKPGQPSAASMVYGELGTERTRDTGYDAAAAGSRQKYSDFLSGGQDELNQYIKGAVSAGMPQLDASLQGAREGAISRGVGLGELGTSYEGDLYSAFQKNIANSAAGQAMNLYTTKEQGYGNIYGTDVNVAEGGRNRYLDLLTGQRDYETAVANAKKKSGGFLGGLLGTVAGSFLGPIGAAVGGKIGSKI